MRDKGVRPGCKTLTNEMVFSDFITAGHDTETMNSAKDIVNTKLPADAFITQWKNKQGDETRIRNKSKQRELLEKQWGEYFTPSRDQKDPEISSTISMGYNTTWTSTYQKEQQINNYEPNMSEITKVPRPIIMRYGADVPKEVLDNIPTFEGTPGELNQFLSTITHKPPNGANTNTMDCKGQHNLVSKPEWTEKTEEPQEQKCHKEILSLHIDDTQKSTYNTKVGSTEATALFDSDTMLSCVLKHFYDHIRHTEPSRVIDTNTGPAIVVTLASNNELINLG